MEPTQGEVKYLADHPAATNDHLDAATLLRKTLEELENGTFTAPTGLMIIGVDIGENKFNIRSRASQLKSSEVVAVLEAIKMKYLAGMGYTSP